MEDVFRRGLLEPGVPHEAHAVRIGRRVWIFVVASHEQLREHRAPIHAGDDTVLGPALVIEKSVESDIVAGFVLESLGIIPRSGIINENVNVLINGTLH